MAGKPTPVSGLLKAHRVVMHPMIIGEVAMGSLGDRKLLLHEFQILPQVYVPNNAEVIAFIEWNQLFGKGIGFIDAHLLAAVKMSEKTTLLTKDNKLSAQAERLKVAYAA